MVAINQDIVFIIGCGRSGTTILGEVLARHEAIINWYEPYFIWDWYFNNAQSDLRQINELTEQSLQFIRDEFSRFGKRSKAKIIIDKTPEHCFKIPFISAIFPKAKWIHIIRDGRDVTLSMNKEWLKRKRIVENKDFFQLFSVIREMISLQPFWRNKLQAILYEIKNQKITFDINNYFNKSKWKGKVGYGPRYPGWQKDLEELPLIQFNALQWVKSLEFIYRDLENIPSINKFELIYEDFIESPNQELQPVFDFLGVKYDDNNKIGFDLNPSNKNKWQKSFNKKDIELIGPLLSEMLIKTGFESKPNWWKGLI